jgi:hypothetical protein
MLRRVLHASASQFPTTTKEAAAASFPSKCRRIGIRRRLVASRDYEGSHARQTLADSGVQEDECHDVMTLCYAGVLLVLWK